ncbi:uncharacterized protein LOC129798174 [Phlebotomus papatasi]|uniref:uncharacterized protein LOC129798174 n=1 Tax=Phlebotomus papatasi TaxID=29031 RepID=UPI00248345D7|nr:uncharacterized protein LOC129798174 [Phlebotomus papatasi]XP_055697158.1 uncharacterized protein LOC129798174 [Phlebotomus papatasi]
MWHNTKISASAWRRFIGVGVLLQIIANCGLGTLALRNVTLIVDPPAVRRSHNAKLLCLYDLEGAPLYSVKFYRGLREFYRYLPSETPKNTIFPFPGIHVDYSLSNASQVVIRNVGFGLSGNFSCEVSADAPSFSTAMAHIQMQVVELPEKQPSLYTEHDRYEPGDVLRANCSCPPSRPKADLTLTLNNIVINHGETQYYQTTDNLILAYASLRLQLQSSHFGGPVPSVGTGLVLRCTAEIGNLYQEYTELELGVPQRDPIPARVTSSRSHCLQADYWYFSLTSIASFMLLRRLTVR